VHPVLEARSPDDWKILVRESLGAVGLKGDLALLTEGPSPANPEANHSLELIEL
jgi:hypothetical protein